MEVGLKSRWYELSEIDDFIESLEPGDIVEFQRKAYYFWPYRHLGIYAKTVEEKTGQRDLIIHMTDHRKNDEKRCKCIEELREVKNNSADKKYPPPRKGPEIVAFAVKEVKEFEAKWDELKRVEDEARQHNDTHVQRLLGELKRWFRNNNYSLFGNNCEHTATYWRNGVHLSRQVKAAIIAGVGTAALALTGLAAHHTGMLSGIDGDMEDDDDDEDEDEDEEEDDDDVEYEYVKYVYDEEEEARARQRSVGHSGMHQ